ncbi:hypothetical protein FRC10_008592 [Ceratobasidium sp. 414]|nr:hypothetical protein FRC10_008592 [Ceratobasidium sp. 414]
MAGIATARVVAEVEQDTQGPLDEQGEVIPTQVLPHTPLLAAGHVASAPPVAPAPALVSASAQLIAPVFNVHPGAKPNSNPAQTTLTGSFYGIGGIQFVDEVPENLAAGVPNGQNVQGLLRSLRGFGGIQFGDKGEDEVA